MLHIRTSSEQHRGLGRFYARYEDDGRVHDWVRYERIEASEEDEHKGERVRE